MFTALIASVYSIGSITNSKTVAPTNMATIFTPYGHHGSQIAPSDYQTKIASTQSYLGLPTGTVTFLIFNSTAQIDLAGTYYSNGQSASLYLGFNYAISMVNSRNHYRFFEWVANSGNFGGGNQNTSTTESTSFTRSSSGSLVLVVHKIWAYYQENHWAGYIESSLNSIYALRETSISFIVPSSSYTAGGGTGTEDVAIWVGLGGYYGSLWQAGVLIQYNDSTSNAWIRIFFEFVPAGGVGSGPQFLSPWSPSPNDILNVSISYNPSTGYSHASFYDWSTGQSWVAPRQLVTPNTQTAEWIVEDPTNNAYVLPSLGGITINDWQTSLIGNSATLIGPITNDRVEVSSSSGQLIQYLNTTVMQYVSNWAGSSAYQFGVDYGQETA